MKKPASVSWRLGLRMLKSLCAWSCSWVLPDRWEIKTSWYSPKDHTWLAANILINTEGKPTETFGPLSRHSSGMKGGWNPGAGNLILQRGWTLRKPSLKIHNAEPNGLPISFWSGSQSSLEGTGAFYDLSPTHTREKAKPSPSNIPVQVFRLSKEQPRNGQACSCPSNSMRLKSRKRERWSIHL